MKQLRKSIAHVDKENQSEDYKLLTNTGGSRNFANTCDVTVLKAL